MYFFFFNDTATTEIYTLSLHDALPIYIPQLLADDAPAQETPRGRHYGDWQHCEASVAAQPTQEIYILHERQAAEASHLLKHFLPDEESLVAKMEKPSGKPREPAIEAQHRVRLVESQLKTAAHHACVLQRLLDVSDEPLRQP